MYMYINSGSMHQYRQYPILKDKPCTTSTSRPLLSVGSGSTMVASCNASGSMCEYIYIYRERDRQFGGRS